MRTGLLVMGIGCWLLVACAKKQSEPAEETSDAARRDSDVPSLTILAPSAGSTVSGQVLVELDIQRVERDLDLYLYADEAADDQAPVKFPSGQARFNTLTVENGTHEVTAELREGTEVVARETVEVLVDNPSFRLLSYAPTSAYFESGQVLEFEVELTHEDVALDADFSHLDPNFDPERVDIEQMKEGRYLVRYELPSSGLTSGIHDWALSVDDGDQALTWDLRVAIHASPRIPFRVAQAIYIDAEPPEQPAASEADPELKLEARNPLLSGVTSRLAVDWEGSDQEYSQLLVSVPEHHGYYVVQTPPEERSVELELADLKPNRDGSLQVRVAPLSPGAEASGWQSTTLEVVDVGLGGLQFSLFWDAPVDMDLIVIDPNETVVDFETPSAAGGHLNLDANALCEISPSNAENISWGPGAATTGTYEVRVNLFDNCGYEGDIHWEIIASLADTGQAAIEADSKAGASSSGMTFSGTLSSSAPDMTGEGSHAGPVTIISAQSVEGVIKFKKRTFAGLLDQVLRYAPVRAVADDGSKTVLAEGMTDDVGAYNLTVNNPEGHRFSLEVEASYSGTSPGAAIARVVPGGSSTPHTFRGPAITPRDGSSHLQNLSIAPSDDSGAFNILDNMQKGYEWVVSQGRAGGLGPLSATWTAGKKNGGSKYRHSSRSYVIQGQASDPDEFDDSVIMHEYMHFVHNSLSFSGPKGSHNGRVKPALAFKEGFATLLGQHVLQNRLYIDMDATPFDSITDLELDPNPEYVGTADGTVHGLVAEDLTSLLVWDLLDPHSPVEPFDRITAPSTVIETFFNELGPRMTTGRGAAGVDLVDFLDGFRCTAGARISSGGSFYDGDLPDILADRAFPYDMDPNPPCP